MTSQPPPSPWFNNINYNNGFFTDSSISTGITLAYANSNYLRITTGSNPISKSTTTTFEGQLIATRDSSSIVSIAKKINITGLSGVVYNLIGISSSSTGTYDVLTDINALLQYSTITNTLTIGNTVGPINGNLTVYGTTAQISMPNCTNTAIYVPSGTIWANEFVTNANIRMNGNPDSYIYTVPSIGGNIKISPRNSTSNQLTLGNAGNMTYGGSNFNCAGNIILTANPFIDAQVGNLVLNASSANSGINLQPNGILSFQANTNAIVHYFNTTLPTTLYVTPLATQLGYSVTTGASSTASSSSVSILGFQSVTLAVGTWLMIGTQTVANNSATAFVPTQTGIWFNPTTALPTVVPYITSSNGVGFQMTGGTTYGGTNGFYRNQCTMILNVTTAGTIVILCLYVAFTGVTTVNINTTINVTRIA